MTATDRAIELAIAAAQAASDKLADDIIAYDVSDVFVITDTFVLASAPTDRQVRAIVDGIEEALRGREPSPLHRRSFSPVRMALDAVTGAIDAASARRLTGTGDEN